MHGYHTELGVRLKENIPFCACVFSILVQRSTTRFMPEDDPVSTSESPRTVRAEGAHPLPGTARHAPVAEEIMAVLWSQQVSHLV